MTLAKKTMTHLKERLNEQFKIDFRCLVHKSAVFFGLFIWKSLNRWNIVVSANELLMKTMNKYSDWFRSVSTCGPRFRVCVTWPTSVGSDFFERWATRVFAFSPLLNSRMRVRHSPLTCYYQHCLPPAVLSVIFYSRHILTQCSSDPSSAHAGLSIKSFFQLKSTLRCFCFFFPFKRTRLSSIRRNKSSLYLAWLSSNISSKSFRWSFAHFLPIACLSFHCRKLVRLSSKACTSSGQEKSKVQPDEIE